MFVRREEGLKRVRSEFRGQNSVTVADSYPMEDVRAALDSMGSKRVLSTIYLKDEVCQIELEERSKDYTAVRMVLKILRYNRLPQGLNISPVAF